MLKKGSHKSIFYQKSCLCWLPNMNVNELTNMKLSGPILNVPIANYISPARVRVYVGSVGVLVGAAECSLGGLGQREAQTRMGRRSGGI